MLLFILILIIVILLLLFAIINFQYTASLSFLFYTFENVPGVLLLYIGIILGTVITVPFMFAYSRKYAHNVLNKSIKQETKRLIQEEKNLKKKQKNNKQSPPIQRENKIN